MSDSDPYKHIRALARSIMHIERQTDEPAAGTTSAVQPLVQEAGADAPPLEPAEAAESRNRPSRRSGTDLGPVAETLKRARLRRGLTQRELGRLAGVPQSHISKIEAGGVDLRLSSLLALTEILGLRFDLVPAPTAALVPLPVGEPASPAVATRAAVEAGAQ